MAAEINELLDHVKLNQVHGVAHDWGSFLLSRLVNYYPQRLLSCSFLTVAYRAPGQSMNVDPINVITKQKLGYEMYGYWKFFEREDAQGSFCAVDSESRALGCTRTGGMSPMVRNHELERNRDGGRGLILSPGQAVDLDEDDNWGKYLGLESELKSWRENEVALLSLAELRGLSKVRIEGTVTEAWAIWLETAMSAGPDRLCLSLISS
jgi:pimeloyl-ACP methyl ester carboxylesterase